MATHNRRGGHKAQVTKIINSLIEELNSDTPSEDVLLAYRDELLRQQNIITNYDSDILLLLNDAEDIEHEISTSSDFTMNIDATIKRLERSLGNNYDDRQSQSSFGDTSRRKDSTHSQTVKLPYIKLMKFTGDSLQWQKFWDLFRSSIHDRNDLSGATKFHYLVSQLTGEAEQLLAGFDHTDGEYEEAVNLLQETYGKTQRLIQARLHAIFDLQSPGSNATELSRFRSLYEGHLRGLKSLGADVDSAGYVFSELLIRRLPTKIRDNLNRAQKSDFWKLEDLRKEIDVEIGHLQSIEPTQIQAEYSSSTAVFRTSATSFTPKCNLCSEAHFPNNCPKYVSVDSKRARVNELRLCYNCLRPKHSAKKCNNIGRCKNCNSRHHTTLCTSQSNNSMRKSDETAVGAVTALSIHNNNTTNIIPTANLSLLQNGNVTKVRAILDTGSQRTFILKSVVRKLNLPIIDRVTLKIDGFKSLGVSESYNLTKITITTSDGTLDLIAVVIDSLPSRINMSGRSKLVNKLITRGMVLADPTSTDDKLSDLGILVGSDFFFQLLGAPKLDDNIYGIPSRIGTIIGGTIENDNNVSCNQVTVLRLDSISNSNSLDDKLQKFWEMDQICTDPSNSNVLSDFEKSISFDDGKYSVKLPWKPNHLPLPDNYYYAKSRLISTLNKLHENEVHLRQYDKIIHDQLRAGFIEEVSDTNSNSYNTHYLAHRGVLREDSASTPLRIVYDCSAKTKGNPSLNDCLYAGPNLINNLSDILLRFRIGKYAASSDIKRAFLNVKLDISDRDCTRFLWPENPFDKNSKLKTYRFSSVLFGSTASPFLLNATLKFHLNKLNSELSDELIKNTYIDNLFVTSNDENSLLAKKSDSIATFSDAGFSLHEWYSNSSLVSDSQNCENFDSKVLGLLWKVGNDQLSVAKVDMKLPDTVTKRSFVGNVTSIFDPLGFLLPVTVKGRIIIQDIWKSKAEWDAVLSDELIDSINKYYSDVQKVLPTSFERCLTEENTGDLHIFSDSSARAYGSVAYLKTNSSVNLIMSKCKLAPIASRTLPELELSAILLSVELANYIIETVSQKLKFRSVYIWSDSSIALHWLDSNNCKRQFVRNRVEKIKESSGQFNFKYVDTLSNPADLLTRGLTSKVFTSRISFWLHGPEWLSTNSWPIAPFPLSCNSDCLFCIDTTHVLQTCLGSDTDEPSDNLLPFLTKYSDINKLFRVTAYVLRFISNCRKSSHSRDVDTLSTEEVNRAENFVVESYQRSYYREIFEYFEGSSNVNNSSNICIPPLVRNLRIFCEDNILRCGGRIHNSDLENDLKFPILLPPKSFLATLLIRQIHEEFHFGINHTIATLRQKYWLPNARQNIKSILHKCITCKKLHCRPFKSTDIPPLPNYRVSESPPFSVTCVDYTGAISVKQSLSLCKYYVCLFTCAITRAVHLELVEDLSAESFIRALQRFSARRSYPRILLSDNATNFTSSSKILTDIFKSCVSNNYLVDHSIEWKFITPSAPWMGGVYERLIGIFKQCLKKVVGKALLSFNELRTVIVQIEGAMNDRPLTYCSDDNNELQPLTPSMLLCGKRILNLPVSINCEELFDPSFNVKYSISKRFTYCTKLIRDLYSRWKLEYLLALREKDRNLHVKILNNVKIGKVVLIHDDVNRMLWKLGLIVKLYEGSDGIVRTVDVKTANGILTRPVVKLYPLELDVD